MSVEWNNLQKDRFITASWDQTIKIVCLPSAPLIGQWTLDRSTSLLTVQAHQSHIYNATWSPTSPTVFATCASDGFLKTFDTRTPQPVHVNRASGEEVLSCDWNKYDDNVLATGGKDKSIRIWDLRAGQKNVGESRGHTLAIRKIQYVLGTFVADSRWSPHQREVIASTSYDMTCRT